MKRFDDIDLSCLDPILSVLHKRKSLRYGTSLELLSKKSPKPPVLSFTATIRQHGHAIAKSNTPSRSVLEFCERLHL
jgi:hypothetical protein